MARPPKTRAGGEWTEARFWTFIRSNLRLMSNKWPPAAAFERNNRRPYTGPRKVQKWEYQCHDCAKWFARKEVQKHHIDPTGTLKSWEDVVPFLQRLLAAEDEYTWMCLECHKAETKRQKDERDRAAN